MLLTTKYQLRVFILYISVFSLTQGCDTIEGDYIEESAPFITDVVLFEFTGIHCPNCPDAHRTIEDLNNKFGLRFRTISIHAGVFANPRNAEEPDFRTKSGDEINNLVNIKKDYPTGSVMNLGKGTNISSSAWSAELGKLGWVRPDVNIEYSIQQVDSLLNAEFKLYFENDVNGDFNFCVYIVENKIVAYQQDGGIINNNYLHNNVLRGTMSGTWGINVEAGTIVEKSFSVKIEKEWQAMNLKVIPFVYNVQTMQVLPSLLKTNK